MAPKDPATKTPSKAAEAGAEAKGPKQSKGKKAEKVKEKPTKTTDASIAKKQKKRVYNTVTKDNFRILLKQVDPTKSFGGGAASLLLMLANGVIPMLATLTVNAVPPKRTICLQRDVETALNAFLPFVPEGDDGFRLHVKDEIEAHFASYAKALAAKQEEVK